jgi:hypothetical protein
LPNLISNRDKSFTGSIVYESGGAKTLKRIVKMGLISVALLGLVAAAQDWYHDRDLRYHEERWRGHVFQEVRMDLDHIGSAIWASGKERARLERTRQELTDLQAKLEYGRYDEHELNDVIDSIRKSSNDNRLALRDREVLNDDLDRLQDYRSHHERWSH